MIGVIVVPGNSSVMHGLDTKRSAALLPVGDRPMLQHIVESLVAQKIMNIELIVDHAPESIEALLGNGDRWGGKFRYHLMSQAELPYKSLKIIPGLKMEPWVLIHAERYPGCGLTTTPLPKPVLFYGESPLETPSRKWKGTAIFPAHFLFALIIYPLLTPVAVLVAPAGLHASSPLIAGARLPLLSKT